MKGLSRKLARHFDTTTRNLNGLPVDRSPFDWNQDLFIGVPALTKTVNTPDDYIYLSRFYRRTKQEQRDTIRLNGLPTPDDYIPHENQWVHRPHRHFGGQDFVIKTTAVTEQDGWYSSPLFNRTHEFRAFFVRGQHVKSVLKKVNEGTPQDTPWNHTYGSRFLTINNPTDNDLLARHTQFYQHMQVVFDRPSNGFNLAAVLAVDVLYNANTQSYAVCEFNFAPRISIDTLFTSITEEITRAYQQPTT